MKTEIAFLAHTHKADKVQRPDLYKQNKMSHGEKVKNLMFLLSDDYGKAKATVANIATNEDTLSAMLNENKNEKQKENIGPKRRSVVIWTDQNGKYSWYLGYLSRSSTDNIIVDHLARETSNSYKA